jgi:hypothetical protein
MTLRGAGVGADVRLVGRVVVGVVVASVAVVVVVLFVAGADKNAQITNLRQHGVPVEITVTTCRGLLGGSGSNAAGYACRGGLTVDGHRYVEAIPGSTLHAPGTTVRAVAARGDPALLTTVGILATEHASWRVYLLPSILLAFLVVLVAALVLRRRRTGGTG